ncbi:uncharacterized protein LOC121639549 [Melanotaenia boesemani]|uniref:uncharacterized protein LOC121639549 n=1 Tax=Melanotaenia boesemani TaxID=1250792 RepID=UPI001C03CFF9|nr:uncharacterized protein LOC121639549 [Melanotaenia boesemani]
MMPQKVQGLLVLAALLLFSTAPIETKVVNSMAECAEFFLQRTPPRIPGILEEGRILDQNRYKPICQTYNNFRTFVTLYDIRNKIPVFSAAKYKGQGGGRPRNPAWNFEPQLENNMKPAEKSFSYENQAGTKDYKQQNPIFDRGHLLPSSYGLTEEEINSTFTLTNIVPQQATFNQGSWNKMESCVKCVLDKYCIDNNDNKEAFVVIGAQPSDGRLLNNKINIPSMLWSAFCCYSSSQNRWLASAHWGENVPEEKNSKKYLQTKTLAELFSKLGGQFNVFPETHCPLETTVSEFYPNLENECKCPPPDLSTTAPPTTASTEVTM